MSKHHLDRLIDEIAPLKTVLMEHSIYDRIQCVEDLRLFMESHIFAVWDFMSLLKALQRGLTCVSVPWFPSPYVASRRLINEIVLGEESDESGAGQYTSHFELYRAAMLECNADVSAVDRFINSLREGAPLSASLRLADPPYHATQFVESTWRFLASGKIHVIAAAFTFGREDLIPNMFRAFIADLKRALPGQLELFQFYLERHVDLDEHSHSPMAIQMMEDLCGNDEVCWREATQAASEAITARIAFWDKISLQIEMSHQILTSSVQLPLALRIGV